jgi:glycine betaine/choline ABC-type transport system substrate-binding protein
MNRFTVVKEIIDKWDPFDLLAIYSPDDEYECEIREIVTALSHITKVEELAEEINSILYQAFEEDFKKSNDCLLNAHKILKALNERGIR